MQRVLRQDCKELCDLRRCRLNKDSVALCADSIVSRGKEGLLLLKDRAHKSMFGWKFEYLGIDNKGKTPCFFLEMFNSFLALLFLRDTE